MGQEARPDDQHALVAQRPESLTERQQPDRVLGRQGHLQHRDVGFGVHDPQRHPGAVVEPATGVLVDRFVVGHHPRDPDRERGGVGGLVGHPVVARRETAEVVDEGCAAGRQAHRRRLPVGADDEDRLRSGEVLGPGGELTGPDRVVEKRWCAVSDVEGWHPGVTHGQSLPEIVVASIKSGGSAQSTGVPPCCTSRLFDPAERPRAEEPARRGQR